MLSVIANKIAMVSPNIACNVHADQIILYNAIQPTHFYASFALDNNVLSLVYRNVMYTDKWKGTHDLEYSDIDSVVVRIVQDIYQITRSS